MTLILAVDQSTSATKVVLFDAAGNVLDKASREHRQIYPQPGWVEHDAEEIWQNVLAAIREVAARHDLASLAGLSITNQRETVVIFDRTTGQPLRNAMVWQCRRGEPLCQRLREYGHESRVRAVTGLRIDSYFPASKLAWLNANEPGVVQRLREGTAVIGTIDSYLVHRLTAGEVFATDYTNASRTMLFDIVRLRWDESLCELFGVPMTALPEPRESAAAFGETDAVGSLPKRVPIVGVMGDSQASLFAQRCYRAGDIKATFGTGTSVLMNIGKGFKLVTDGTLTALAWVWRGKPTYALEGIINFSAATIEWLRHQLGVIREGDDVEQLALSVPNNGGVYFVPAFSGLGAPHWASRARAAIVGMTAHTSREHVVRAALEAVAFQLRDVLDMMRVAGVRPGQIHVDGGPTRNRFLMQFAADITGETLSVSEVLELSAWGAAMNGLLALRIMVMDEVAALARPVRLVSPTMSAAAVDSLYRGWLEAVRRVI